MELSSCEYENFSASMVASMEILCEYGCEYGNTLRISASMVCEYGCEYGCKYGCKYGCEYGLQDTLEKLELSYTSLEDDYKEIFLDIACILKGELKEDANRILECCGFHARIEEMEKNIVHQSHPDEPNKHSRMWIKEEIEEILAIDMLKHLDISHSKLRTFDLRLTPNLETLSLKNCADFEELHVSIACSNLKILNLIKSRLRSLDLELIPNLERIDLQ
ncbi:NB-ARC domains-containing protein [Artemisia annua]|uniref:NB-ARC domains-containing protein n=1 Tax=Artemisia annua TaxID=35608 RepID=A0A2U1LD77_ARTAN|nr:NB-ARC domains-containing protein [Artemisia annua]